MADQWSFVDAPSTSNTTSGTSAWSFADEPQPKPTGVLGFLKGAMDVLNPFPAIGNMATKDPYGRTLAGNLVNAHKDTAVKAYNAFNTGDYSSAVGYGLATALPVIGPAAAKVGEDMGEGMATGEMGYPAGETIGMIGSPFAVEGFNAIAPKLGPLARASAENVYARALRPTTMRMRKWAGENVVPEALDRGMWAGSDNRLLDQVSSGKRAAQTAMDTGEQDIINRENAARVMNKLTGTKSAGTVRTYPVQPIVDWLEDMRFGRRKGAAPSVVNGQIVNPMKDRAITSVQNALREMANQDEFGNGGTGTATFPYKPWGGTIQQNVPLPSNLSEGALLQFRRALDDMIQGKHDIIPGGDNPAPLSITRPLSNYLRDVFNRTHPDLAEAFRDYQFFKRFETLLNRKQIGETGLTGFTRELGTAGAAIGAMAHAGPTLQGAGEAALAAGTFNAVLRASRSTAWRTFSAVAKSHLANAMANGQFALANTILNRSGLLAGAMSVDVSRYSR